MSPTEEEAFTQEIRKVSVTKLFGLFDHEIPLNLEERITIIHGPNGFGKTALLRLVNALFVGRDPVLRKIPYVVFRVDFADDTFLRVRQLRSATAKKAEQVDLIFEAGSGDKVRESFTLPPPAYAKDPRFADLVEHQIRFLDRVGPETWRDVRGGGLMDFDEVIERYADELPPPLTERLGPPPWLVRLRESVPVRFIEAQRLIVTSVAETRRRPATTHAVVQYANELAELIQTKLGEYATLSQSLDRSFPARLLEEGPVPSGLSESDLTAKLKALEEKRTRLTDAGLLDKEEAGSFRMSQLPVRVDERTRGVLSVYVRDVEQKLSVFDDMLARIEFLKEVISDRFLYKSVRITRDEGYTFVSVDGARLRPSDLSSGEQHEIVLLHTLLFKSRPNAMILVDEPELSLHIAWQERFLRDLQQIARLSRIHVLLATHSPQIISDRWDLAVELKGPAA